MDKNAPSMLKPTMLGGGLAGVLVGLPFLNVVNYCTCCSLVVLGGFMASMLYSRLCHTARQEFRPGNGALVGLIAGAFYAVGVTLVGTVSAAAVGQPAIKMLLEWMLEFMQSNPDVPAESLDQVESALEQLEESGGGISFVSIIFSLFWSVLVGAVFSTLGGLIGGAVFKVEPPAPAPSVPAQGEPTIPGA